MYLDQLESGLSVTENIQAICFARDGYLRGEFSRLLSSLFNNYEKHTAIVRALANKRIGLTRTDLVKAVGEKDGGSFTRTLDELIESGFLSAYRGYQKNQRGELYRLTDHYSLFYLTYLEKLGRSRSTEFTELSSLPSWYSWAGYAFETVCLTHVKQIKHALGISGISTTVSSFYHRGGAGNPGAQIDLLIERRDATIHLCEAKFSKTPLPLTTGLAKDFRKKAGVFRSATGSTDHLLYTLLTTFPPQGDINNSEVDRVVTMDALFR